MRKSREYLDIPVIVINEGKEVGKVQSLVINRNKGSVEFITVDLLEQVHQLGVIPYGKMVGVGEYALTVELADDIVHFSEIPILNSLIEDETSIIDTKVIDRKGDYLGKVSEYVIRVETGEIMELILDNNDTEKSISSADIITYGTEVIITKELTELSNMMDGNFTLEEEERSIEAIENVQESEEEIPFVADDSEKIDLFYSKQAELLEGKIVEEDIYSDGGTLLLKAGTVLTREDIERLRNSGVSKLIELSIKSKEV